MRILKKFVKDIIQIKPINIVALNLINFIKPLFFKKNDKLLSKIPVNRNVTVRTPKSTFVMYNNGDDTIVNKIYWLGSDSYEPETFRILVKLLTHNQVFFDIGANTGLYSLLAASITRISRFMHLNLLRTHLNISRRIKKLTILKISL